MPAPPFRYSHRRACLGRQAQRVGTCSMHLSHHTLPPPAQLVTGNVTCGVCTTWSQLAQVGAGAAGMSTSDALLNDAPMRPTCWLRKCFHLRRQLGPVHCWLVGSKHAGLVMPRQQMLLVHAAASTQTEFEPPPNSLAQTGGRRACIGRPCRHACVCARTRLK